MRPAEGEVGWRRVTRFLSRRSKAGRSFVGRRTCRVRRAVLDSALLERERNVVGVGSDLEMVSSREEIRVRRLGVDICPAF